MSSLVVHELGLTGAFGNTELKQLITVDDRDLDIVHIRPHLYRHLSPTGSLYMQVQDTNGKKIVDSAAVSIAALKAGTNVTSLALTGTKYVILGTFLHRHHPLQLRTEPDAERVQAAVRVGRHPLRAHR